MNTLVTDKKYTVILSAYQAANSELDNLRDSQILHRFIEVYCHCHAINAVGVYNGSAELSFVIHTNSSNTVHQLKRSAFEVNNQECVLISNNRKHDIQLHFADAVTSHIGTKFVHNDKAPKQATSYTILNGYDYWSVI